MLTKLIFLKEEDFQACHTVYYAFKDVVAPICLFPRCQPGMAYQAEGYVMLEDPTSKTLKSSLTLKGKSFLHNKQVGDRLHPSCEVFAYLVLRGKMHLNPQFANLSSSSMGAIGPGVNSIEEVLEFPVKRMSKGAKIYSSSTHKEGLTRSWNSCLQRLIAC